MTVSTAVDDDAVEGVLDRAEAIRLATFEGEAEMFVLAAHFADLNDPATVHDTGGALFRGEERAVRVGGPGTPRVAEFAVAHFAARVRMSTYGGRRYIADALDARHRLPRCWERVQAREARVSYVRHVAQATRELSTEAAEVVDAAVVDIVDGRVGWGRFTLVVEGAVKKADPEAAAKREAEAAERQFAKASRSQDNGMKGFYVRSTIGAIAQIDAVVSYLAEGLRALGDPDTEDQRRVKAVLVLTNPEQALDLLRAFAGHRAAKQPAAGESGTGGESGGGDRRQSRSEDEPLTLPDDDPGLESDPEPEPEPEHEDARPTCASCGGQPTGDPTAFLKPFLNPQRFRPDLLSFDPSHPAYREGAAGSWHLDMARLLPRVTLMLHLSEESIRRGVDGVARWEGEGPVTARYVRDVLALHHRFSILPVLDLANQAPVDAYEIPDRHKLAVHIRTPADGFPFAPNISPHKDVDHVVPFDSGEGDTPDDSDEGPSGLPPGQPRGHPPGQSNMGNYLPMARFHHRVKTHGTWQVQQPFPGIYIWRDPYGHFYLVDHTGTRKLTKPRRRSGADPSVDEGPLAG